MAFPRSHHLPACDLHEYFFYFRNSLSSERLNSFLGVSQSYSSIPQSIIKYSTCTKLGVFHFLLHTFPKKATSMTVFFYFDHIMRSLSKFVLELKRVIQLIYYNKFTASYDSAISFCRIYTLILPQILLLLAVAKARKWAKRDQAINSHFANSLRKFSPSLHASSRVFDFISM